MPKSTSTAFAKMGAACAALLLVATGLSACSDPDSAKTETDPGQSADASSPTGADPESFDVSVIEAQPEVVALVPEAIKESGVLRNGASTDYAPAEFRAADGQTPIGYEVDIVNALAKVMGLNEGTTEHAEFPTIIPALGTKFDIGMSSFTITPERIENTNMVSYSEVGSAYAVAAGNPTNFDPTNICGSTIGVQNGTYQVDLTQALSDECVAEGKDPVEIMPHDLQTDIATKVIGGQYDATFADSTVIGYAVRSSKDELEQIGDVIESEPQGIALAKDDKQLTEAVQAAMQYLMDSGYLDQIMANWGTQDAALTTAEINPSGK